MKTNMKKKLLCALMSVAMVASFLVGCGSSSKPAAEQSTEAAKAESNGKKVGVAMPTQSSERWINDGKNMKSELEKLGYEVGSGCLVGLPNQTVESLADDILFFKEIGADMIGIGPFIAHPHTPLKNAKNGDFTLALKVMALTRLVLKDINIPATTAMETLNPKGRIIALQSGANVVMPNVTTTEFRAKYEIYPGKICINENPTQCRGCIEGKIKSIGRTIATDKGFHRGLV